MMQASRRLAGGMATALRQRCQQWRYGGGERGPPTSSHSDVGSKGGPSGNRPQATAVVSAGGGGGRGGSKWGPSAATGGCFGSKIGW